MNPSALLNISHMTWHRWSSPAEAGWGWGGEQRGPVREEQEPRRTLLPLSSPFSPRCSAPSLPCSLSRSLTLSPLLNWHRSGCKHDNSEGFLGGALSGSPRPRSPPTQISRRQGEGGGSGERIAVSYQRVLGGNNKRPLYRTHARTRSYVLPRITDLWKCSTRLKVKMHVRGLIRATLGFVGFCLVAFVQQSASGSKATQGKFSPHIYLFLKPLLIPPARWYSCKAGGGDQRWCLWVANSQKLRSFFSFLNTLLQVVLDLPPLNCFVVSECSVKD